MDSLIYNSAIDDMARGAIDFDTDTFKVMLVTSAYVADRDNHLKRSSVTNEVTGTGYTAGGVTTACTVTKDTANDKVTIEFAAVSWPSSTITARGAVYYKSTGGAASTDALVAYNDFGDNFTTGNETFTVNASTLTLQAWQADFVPG
jgi:hypothetical protein